MHRMKRLALIAALVAFPAHAQTNCGCTADAYAMLAERFGEERIWMGQTDTPGAMAEIWGSLQTGSLDAAGDGSGRFLPCQPRHGLQHSPPRRAVVNADATPKR